MLEFGPIYHRIREGGSGHVRLMREFVTRDFTLLH